jgi:hypothetical protein
VLQTDTNSITQILNIQDSLEKENKKWSCNKSLMIKKFTVITLENYFITWSIVFTISANKSSRIAVVLFCE